MVYNDFLNALMVLISQGFLGSYVMTLIEFRRPVRVFKLKWILIIVTVVSVNVFLILFCNFWDMYLRVGVFTVTLPYILTTLWCSRYKGLRVVFNICTCIWLGCIGNANGTLAHAIWQSNPWIHVVMRCVTYLALYFVVRKFRPYYQKALYILDRGWGVLCLIPSVSFIATLYLINNFLQDNPLPVAVVIYSLTIICTVAYILIYLLFARATQIYELKNNQDIMSAQIAALKRYADASRAMEEETRIQRHDMRHQWITLAELVERGEEKATLDFIEAVERRLDEIAPAWQCENSILNATFSSYFYRAKEEDIMIEAELSVGEEIPADSAELSMALANALDNAIKACVKLPREKRRIVCRCVDRPRLNLVIENPYIGEVKFSGDGFPVDKNGEVGVGVRSILAFCKKYNAERKYRAKNGLFRLEISIEEREPVVDR